MPETPTPRTGQTAPSTTQANPPRATPAKASPGRRGQLRTSQRRVLQALSWSDGLTRTALANELGMPKATVTGLVDSLIARGLVSEAPPSPSRGKAGRPPKVLSATGPSPTTGAVVVSGGQLVAALVTYSGEVLGRASGPFSGAGNDAETIKIAIELLHEAIDQGNSKRAHMAPAGLTDGTANAGGSPAGTSPAGLTSIVLGIPAPFLAKAGLTPLETTRQQPGRAPAELPNFVRWVNQEVVTQMQRELGVPTIVENDANLGAMGEATFGAGRDVDSFVFLKLARGVGAGLVFGGRLHRGETGFAGELAHVHVRDDGPLCPCGGRGCLGGAIGDAIVEAVQPAYDQRLSLRDVLDLAAQGEPGPRRVLGDLGRTLGRPLADFASLLNPGAIIVDGSFAPAVEHVVAGIRESIDRYAAPVAAEALSVYAGALGEDAELLGAAVLARQKQAETTLRYRSQRM